MMKSFLSFLLLVPFSALAQTELPYIQHDDFASNAFGFKVTVSNFHKKYSHLNITTKPITNRYNKNITDTLYYFRDGKTNIEIYHAQPGDILQSAFIASDKIVFRYNIKIGDTKVAVAKALHAAINSDKVEVGDLEHGQVYTFTFAGGRLISVSYEGYIE